MEEKVDKAILDKLIQCYETDMDELYGGEHDEIFKWRPAVFMAWKNRASAT